jgi:hypothetical protein
MKTLYLINPKPDFPTYFAADYFAEAGLPAVALIADLAIPSLATMAGPYLNVTLCDELIQPVDTETAWDIVGITGKISQYQNMIRWAAHFRGAGKLVVMGGSLATLSPELLRPHCDVLVKGEIEEIAPELFADLAAGTFDDEYVGGRPDMDTCSIPRWQLYPNQRALIGPLQTSRGCPFQCEFCDVIQYVGRKQRHKPVALVLAELDELYRHGYRAVFLADDNFTVYRARARELLLAIRAWNRRRDEPVRFFTQLSIDIAKDSEILTLCAEAGLTTVFIGIETPSEDSLRETGKRQNLRVNLVDSVNEFFEHGIGVIGGMIVGFDADGAHTFRTQYDFASASSIPCFTVGALVAPAATPLRARLQRDGRIRSGSEAAATPWSTNIVHPTLSHDELIGGLRWLANGLYSPEHFGDRLEAFVGKLRPMAARANAAPQRRSGREIEFDTFDLIGELRHAGQGEAQLWKRVMSLVAHKPDAAPYVFGFLANYLQIRLLLRQGQFWEPSLAELPAPPANLTPLRTRTRLNVSSVPS